MIGGLVAAALALLGGPANAAGPAPERGAAVVLERVSGRVYVRREDARRYHRLRALRRLPVGTTVDAQEGAVRLTVARDERGGTWSAVFSAGKFTVRQPRRGAPVTTLELTGPSYADRCGKAAAARRKPRRVRRLWGDGHGRFRTAGRYAAATVRGTHWLTEDRCDGTLTRVLRGVVEVEDFTAPVTGGGEGGDGEPPPASAPQPSPGAEGRTVVVGRGESYVARPGT